MIRNGALTLVTFLSALLFPWPLTAVLAVGTALFEPLVPLAVGIFVDTLYYVPHSGAIPVFTLFGLILSVIAFVVRSRLSTGSIG